MISSMRRITIGAIFFGGTCVIAIGGYIAAGWKPLDAVYMVVITVFGVGYGEAKPLDSASLKVFTMGVIIAGCSSGIYVVGGFVQMLAEGEINRALGTRRMSKGIEKLSGHTLICGFGRVGQMIATEIVAAKQQFVVIDLNEGRIAEAQALGYLTVRGSASEEATLEAAGIHQARTLVTVLPDDTINVFITLTARGLSGEIEIIARAENPATEKKLYRSGANRVVLPALIGATKIAQFVTRPSAEQLLTEVAGLSHLNDELKAIGLQMSEIEIEPNSALATETVANLEVTGNSGFVLVAIKKPSGSLVCEPPGETQIQAGDVVIVLGHGTAVPDLARRARRRGATVYRGVTV